MSTQMKKLFLLIVALGVLFTATTIAAPSQAAAPPSDRISISVDSRACTVTATYSWKNYDPATFQWASLNIYTPLPDGTRDHIKGWQTSDITSGPIIVTATGVPGQSYYAAGYVYSGGPTDESWTRTATLRCR